MADPLPNLLEAALAIAAGNVPVFPCNPRNKHPLTPEGFYDATTDEVQIRKWWNENSFSMIGRPTGQVSNCFVLDIDFDLEKKKDGFVTLAALEAAHSKLPETLTCRTPRGGEHKYFACHPDIKGSAERIGKDLDIRGPGNYVIMPPSIRSDRKAYRWRDDLPQHMAMAPDWLIELVKNPPPKPGKKANGDDRIKTNGAGYSSASHSGGVAGNTNRTRAYGLAALDAECEELSTTPEGRRNDQLNKSAFAMGQLMAGGVLGEYEIRKQLTAAALACGLPRPEIEKTLAQGLTAGQKSPRGLPDDDWIDHFPQSDRVGPDPEAARKTPKAETKSAEPGAEKAKGDPGDQKARAEPGDDDAKRSNDDAKGAKAKEQRARRDFEWITATNITGPVLNGLWLVKGFVPRHGLGVVYGRPGGGKSVLATDMALHVANGMSWRDLRTVRAGVAYVASEAGRAMGTNRVLAWHRHNDKPLTPNFHMSPLTLNLRTSEADARALAFDINENQPGCALIIIDTLARNLAGGNENASEDMGALVANVALLEHLTGAFVILIHHSGKDETKGGRGHTSLLGAIDLELEARRAKGEPGILTVTKLRDGPDGAEFGFNVVGVELGLDDDGVMVTAPVAVETGVSEASVAKVKVPQGAAKIAFDLLVRAIADAGEIPPTRNHIPKNTRTSQTSLWRRYCYEGIVAESDKPDTKQRAFARACQRLQALGIIGIWGDYVWVTGHAGHAQT